MFLSRIQSDHDRTPDAMRRALPFKDGLDVHRACGAFVHCLGLLEKQAPPDAFRSIQESLHRQFQSGFMDADLAYAVEQQVPPLNLDSVTAIRPFLADIQRVTQQAKEKHEEELNAKVRVATLTSVMAKLEADLDALASRQPNSSSEAIKHAKDLKYVRDRQTSLDMVD